MVDLNITLVIQIVNFLIALILLNFILIKPIRDILKKRRGIVEGLAQDADKSSRDAAERIRKYELELDAARASAVEQRDAIKQQGLDSELTILAEAQSEAQAFLQKSRKEVEREVAEAMKSLSTQVDAMAGKVMAKVLE